MHEVCELLEYIVNTMYTSKGLRAYNVFVALLLYRLKNNEVKEKIK